MSGDGVLGDLDDPALLREFSGQAARSCEADDAARSETDAGPRDT